MTRLVILFVSLLLIGSGKIEKIRPDGIWILAYSLRNSKPETVYLKRLIEFRKDSVNLILIGDPNTGDLRHVKVEKFQFKLKRSNNTIAFGGHRLKISYNTDSLVLHPEREPNSGLVYKKLDPKHKAVDKFSDCFKGSYILRSSSRYNDSISFISDSTLLYTGDNHKNSPTERWNIMHYGGFGFLNVHSIFTPLSVIKSCSSNKVILIYHYQKEFELTMTPVIDLVSKEKLIGRWTEIQSSLKPPTPPHLEEKDQYYNLEIKQDSIQIKYWGRILILKWDLTTDGKRIYFKDKIFKEGGSWKLLNLTDSTMTFMESTLDGLDENIVRLRRNQKN